jgi:hypothetical protein
VKIWQRRFLPPNLLWLVSLQQSLRLLR